MAIFDSDSIEQKFAEAALNPALWVETLEIASTATRSYGSVLIPVSGGVLPSLPFTRSMEASFETYIRDGWHLRDERMRGEPRMMDRGVVVDLDLFDAETIAKHPYYQEFLAPHKLRWWAGVNISSGGETWCLSLQRRLDEEPFSENEQSELARLSKRLSGSAAIARALGATASNATLAAFEISDIAAVLINRHGKVFHTNQAALRLFDKDLHIADGHLFAQNIKARLLLNTSIGELLKRNVAGMAKPVFIPRENRRPALAYSLRPSNMAANILADCQIITIVVDTELTRRPTEEALQAVFHLTKAEARLAAQLSTGESLEVAAERLNIAKETSRSQLRGIFVKTKVGRQAELVAVLSTFLYAENSDVQGFLDLF